MAIFAGLSPIICDAIRPRPRVRTVEWAAAHLVMPPRSEIQGAWRPDLFPHMVEPLDCCDDPYYEQVTVEAASRNGKTAMSLAFLAKSAATDPHPAAFGDADQRSTERVLERAWEMFDACKLLKPKILLAPSRRSNSRIELADMVIEGAWSGSAATAADYCAKVIVLNEIDKYSKDKSNEAPFLNLMTERAKGYLGSTVILISTPSLVNQSAIRAARESGDNRARYVPCPHCNHFQTLRRGDGAIPGGLRWEKDSKGHTTPQLAEETAWYECERCRKKILDHHRPAMLNAGLYVAEGQKIVRGKVVGKKLREGRHASFGPLPTLYSLLPSIDLGKIARKYVEAKQALRKKGDRGPLRNYVNSWDCEVWDPRRKKVEVHQLTERLGTEDPRGVCPPWSVFLTQKIDLGGDADEFYWQVCAWGAHERGQVIDWGLIFGPNAQQDLKTHIFGDGRGQPYPHADGGIPLYVKRTGLDSGDGDHTETVYRLCEELKRFGVVPTKGLTGKFAEMIRPSVLSGDPHLAAKLKASAPNNPQTGRAVLFHENHERTQRWIQSMLHGDVKRPTETDPGHPNAFTLCREAAHDENFLAQLLAEYPHDETNEDGYPIHTWTRTGPNEQRDCCRGNRALASLLTNFDANWATQKRVPVLVGQSAQPQRPTFTTPDGRPFYVGDRR